MNFLEQKTRKDVLKNIILNIDIPSKKLYKMIITDNKTTDDERRIGFLFETISILLIIGKCLKIEYNNIMDGQLQSLKICKNINILLEKKISQGNNPSDITIKHNDKIIAFSVKYRNKFIPNQSSVSELDGELSKTCDNYLIGLIVKSKNVVIEHNYKNDGSNQKKLHTKVINDNLLLDENDIIEGLDIFCEKFKNIDIEDYIELINRDYLDSKRKQLKLKLHQKMTYLNFLRNKKELLHLISHKPRSGKSITILTICKYLLENGNNKILIMTSVPDTINSFIKDLDEYIDFKDIKYNNQQEFKNISKEYKGIVFCSVQYLKINPEEKKEYLKNIRFDTMIIDECHMGSSTIKTEKNILNIEEHIDNIRSNIKMNIFASGTADKTKKFYKIKNVYEWTIEDESYMKRLLNSEIENENKDEIVEIMKNRHGDDFDKCYKNTRLNKDYSKHPTQVLLKHSIPESIINDIKEYNIKNKTEYGYSCSSLFGLIKNVKKNKYDDMFELEKDSDGIELLKSFFECIISSNRMNKNTMIKKIEETQSYYKSRLSQKGEPKLFLVYLPIHTGNNNISQLQKNIKRFIEKYSLWSEYNIEYSNSNEDSSDYKEEYNNYILTILDKTKKENKKGCILLLGNKGSVGITYHDCDVTISLDDGHNLDNQRQRFSRALTEGENKTVGVNVDMNIQRTYLYLNDIIHKHRKIRKTTKTNGEILKYLYENQIFLFNPIEINNGKIRTFEITEFFTKEANNIIENIDDTKLLNNIIVTDEDVILDKDEIALEFTWDNTSNNTDSKNINRDLFGDQLDCPKGVISKVSIVDKNCDDIRDSENNTDNTEENKIEKQKRILKEICIRVLIPLLSLISRTYTQLNFTDMFINNNTKDIINDILHDKKIILNKNSYNSIIKIMNNNDEIINNIREIYQNAPANKIHQLISKHFIPSIEERKNNAEIPTPLQLVEEMLDKMPKDFWKKKNKVFEPCCGKGNFVMKIFEKFYDGLSERYPDKKKRCKIIITKCIYYGDITPMNVFITTEILKCEIQSRTENNNEIKYKFNSNVGNTLELDVKDKFGIDKFDAIIGNPPYEEKNASGDNKLYLEFTKYGLNKLNENKYLLFITPRNILEYILLVYKNRKYIEKLLQINFISIETSNKYFKKIGSTFAYFLIENTEYYKKTIIEYLYCNKIESIEIKLIKGYKIPRILTKLDIQIINKLTSKNNYKLNDFMFGKKTQRIRKDQLTKKTIMTTETSTHKIKIIDTINKTNLFPGKYYYYDKKDNDFDSDKLILSKKGYLMPYVDRTKSYTYSDNFKYIIDDNLDEIKLLFDSIIIKYLLYQFSKNGFDSINIIKMLDKKNLNKIKNESDILKLYNINDEEFDHVKLLLGLNNDK